MDNNQLTRTQLWQLGDTITAVERISAPIVSLLNVPFAKELAKIFFDGIKSAIAAGKMNLEVLNSKKGRRTLKEMYDFLHDRTTIPDEAVFEVLKAILIKSLQEERSSDTSVDPIQYARIIRMLNENQLIVISTCYKIYKLKLHSKDGTRGFITSTADWRKLIATHSELKNEDLIHIEESDLMKLRLIGSTEHPDASGISSHSTFRMTKLAIEIMQYIENTTDFKFNKSY